MSIAVMKYVSDLMKSMDIPYAFGLWKEKPPDRYWTGSFIEPESMTRDENGMQETTVILRGNTWGDWILLMQDKEKIEKNASQTAILPDGTGIAVSYAGADIVPTGDSDFKSIKINLDIQEWKVN